MTDRAYSRHRADTEVKWIKKLYFSGQVRSPSTLSEYNFGINQSAWSVGSKDCLGSCVAYDRQDGSTGDGETIGWIKLARLTRDHPAPGRLVDWSVELGQLIVAVDCSHGDVTRVTNITSLDHSQLSFCVATTKGMCFELERLPHTIGWQCCTSGLHAMLC